MQKPDHPLVPATVVVNEEENRKTMRALQCFSCDACAKEKRGEGKRSFPIAKFWLSVAEAILKDGS